MTSFTLMRFKPQCYNIPRKPLRNRTDRTDRSQDVNLPRPYARQPQPSGDKNISKLVENRGLNRKSVKGHFNYL